MSYCYPGRGRTFAWMPYIRMPDAVYFNTEHVFFNDMHYKGLDEAYARDSITKCPEYSNRGYSMNSLTECPEYINKAYSSGYHTSCPKGFNTAYAMIIAGPDYPSITGLVTFTDTPAGTMVCADVRGLPEYRPAADDKSPVGPF